MNFNLSIALPNECGAVRAEGLRDVVVESLRGGRWTTCCNILRALERIPRDRLAAHRRPAGGSVERLMRDPAMGVLP